jgi:hypothetical protein
MFFSLRNDLTQNPSLQLKTASSFQPGKKYS